MIRPPAPLTRSVDAAASAFGALGDDLHSFLMQASVPIAVLRCPELVYEFSNPANQRYFDGRELVGKRVEDLPEATPEILSILRGVAESGRRFEARELPIELTFEGRRAQHFIDLVYEPIRGSSGRVERILVTGSDVTETVLARRRSEEIASQRELITDALPALVSYIDRGYRYRFANAAYGRWFSCARESVIGRHAREVLGETAFENARPFMDRCLAGERISFETVQDYRHHGKRAVQAEYVPDRAPGGEVRGLVALVTDITERREADEHLRRSKKELEEAVRARQDLLNVCGHELKTPLSSLKLQTQTARRRIARGDPNAFDPARVTKLLETYERQIDRLVSLVDDMLDLTRISSGRLPLNRERVNLSALVYEVLDRLSEQVAAAGCRISVSAHPAVVGRWDRFRIEQVVTNLLTNAMRYGRGAPIAIEVEPGEGRARLTVRDQGMGIAPENQERIFQRFERAVPATEISGLGLGLFIVREILQAHGGTIRVTSELGQGAAFEIELPLAAEQEGAPHE